MRKCSVGFNIKRAGFPVVKGVMRRAANVVTEHVNDKGIQIMKSTLLQCLCLRLGAFKVPMNTADAWLSELHGGPAYKHTEVFA